MCCVVVLLEGRGGRRKNQPPQHQFGMEPLYQDIIGFQMCWLCCYRGERRKKGGRRNDWPPQHQSITDPLHQDWFLLIFVWSTWILVVTCVYKCYFLFCFLMLFQTNLWLNLFSLLSITPKYHMKLSRTIVLSIWFPYIFILYCRFCSILYIGISYLT